MFRLIILVNDFDAVFDHVHGDADSTRRATFEKDGFMSLTDGFYIYWLEEIHGMFQASYKRRDCWLWKGRKDRAAHQGTGHNTRHTTSAILLYPVSYCTFVRSGRRNKRRIEQSAVCGLGRVGSEPSRTYRRKGPQRSQTNTGTGTSLFLFWMNISQDS